ncbi:hypothetical protein [Haladaptatus cibarius]|uniref:hypothetical protein n=1 Tax=Haladaptatus cibarius TaxID=453847 RepID=UPI00130E1F02|nr:hypothetical protein [Haladaptatus cibarius]
MPTPMKLPPHRLLAVAPSSRGFAARLSAEHSSALLAFEISSKSRSPHASPTDSFVTAFLSHPSRGFGSPSRR